MRDEPFADRVPLGRRMLVLLLTVLAMPFLVVAGAVSGVVLAVLPVLARWMMAFTVFLIIPAAVFAYHHDWNSAAQVGVIFVVVGAITGGICSIVDRPRDITVRLR